MNTFYEALLNSFFAAPTVLVLPPSNDFGWKDGLPIFVSALAIVMAAISLYVSWKTQQKSKLREFRAEAYTTYLKGLATKQLAGHESNSTANILQGKFLGVLYGSPSVVRALREFEFDVARNDTDPARRTGIFNIVKTMRLDLHVEGAPDRDDIFKVLFNSEAHD